MTASTGSTVSEDCTREAIRRRAESYLAALAAGDTDGLRLHPSVRYTENGREEVLGLGLWLSRPRADFARHVLDVDSCSSVTEAVLSSTRGRTIMAVRLLAMNDQLLEIESQSVPENATRTDPDAILARGPDAWVMPVAATKRMSREAMIALAEAYFDTATGTATQPAHAPDCRRRQNGIPMASMGDCGVPSGDMRFTQRRYPVVDELTGILTAPVIYNGHLGIYLFKMMDATLYNIDVIGGISAATSGW